MWRQCGDSLFFQVTHTHTNTTYLMTSAIWQVEQIKSFCRFVTDEETLTPGMPEETGP